MDGTRISFGAWLGIVLLFLFFGVFVLVLIGLSPRGNNYEAKRAEQRRETLKKVQDEANTELHSYAWVDKNKGVVRIPIDRAMELTVTALAQKTPAPANPIETPAPAGQPSPGVSPAASAAPGQSPGPSPAVSASPGQTPGPAASPQLPATQTGASQPSATPSAPPNASITPKPTSVSGKDSENRNQPAAAANPPGAQPGSQPGPSASPIASPGPPSGQPAVSPSGTPEQSPPGTPLPVPGKTP
jgi:hypothetical protein